MMERLTQCLLIHQSNQTLYNKEVLDLEESNKTDMIENSKLRLIVKI